MTERLVVIGAGMAAGRLLDELTRRAPGRFAITIFAAEPRGSYDRIRLSPVLAGEARPDEVLIHDAGWYAAQGIDARLGVPVRAIDTARRVVVSDAGDTPYDRLVIATGSSCVVPDLPGTGLEGVIAWRDLDDTAAMIARARPGARAVVIGGGLLGLEAAAGLQLRGMAVTVLQRGGHLMNQQLDAEAAELLARALHARGIALRCRAETVALHGTDGHVRAVELACGTRLPAELVVFAAGIRPNAGLGAAAGLAMGRGLIIDEGCATSAPGVHALGECAEFGGQTFGLVAPLYDMAAVLADRLCGGAARFRVPDLATRLKVTGCDLYSAGDFAARDGREEIVLRDPARARYRRLILDGDRLIGAVLYGDTADGPWFFELIRTRTPVTAFRDTLIFGPDFSTPRAGDPLAGLDTGRLPDPAPETAPSLAKEIAA